MGHLTYFAVENFKRFEHFEMNNLGQFNLMWGDNNVGKTSVLEALLFHPEPHTFKHYLLTVLFTFRRFDDITNSYWFYFANRKKIQDLQGKVTFRTKIAPSKNEIIDELRFQERYGTYWKRTFNNDIRGVHIIQADDVLVPNPELFLENRFAARFDGTFTFGDGIKLDGTFYPHPRVPYIPLYLGYEHSLTRKFTKFIQASESATKKLATALSCMIPGAKDVVIQTEETSPKNPILLIRQEGQDQAMPLGTFGDGAIKLFRILVEIVVHKGERLMIDEIDSGVHVSRFHDFLRAILLAAKEHNVQIFATTHNYECLKFFTEVLEEEEMAALQADARGIKLIATPDGGTKGLTYTFENLQNAFENDNDPRAVMRFAEDVR